jgi:hypothetical protein
LRPVGPCNQHFNNNQNAEQDKNGDMKLTESEAMARFAAYDHGVLCTSNAERGVDAVPAVYGVDDGWVGIPVDRVKPKSSARLQRIVNLEYDPRATLLIDQWNRDDWSQLWWVRASLEWEAEPSADLADALARQLVERFRQYQAADQRPFDRILAFRIRGISGWSASDPQGLDPSDSHVRHSIEPARSANPSQV